MNLRRWIAVSGVVGCSLGGVNDTLAQRAATEPEAAAAVDPASIEVRYLQGLRARGYYDLALDHINAALADATTPDALKPVYTFEIGRSLLDEATAMPDLERRQALLDQARQKLDAFSKAFPGHPLASEALMQFARLNLERGHTSLLMADDVKTEDDQGKPLPSGRAERESKLAAARAAFGEARKAYDQAREKLTAAYNGFPQFIPRTDPRFEPRERARDAFLDAELQRGVVDYEEAQTHAMGTKERAELLDKAIAQFAPLVKDFRTNNAGLHAQMLTGKSHEEKGEIREAMGIYKDLMEHSAVELRQLQRQVQFYQVICDRKRGEYALAADEAVRWLEANANYRTTEEGLGVQLELAKNIIAQLPNAPEEERGPAIRRAVDALTQVAKFYSPYKPEALKLLREHQPKSAIKANQIAVLTYDDAMTQAQSAIDTHDWPLAEALLRQAMRRAERSREIEPLNRARFMLAFVYYASDRYYEALVIAEHLAKRYPEAGLSPRAAEIGLASLTQAYNTFTAVDRLSDLDSMVELAKHTVEKWGDTDQGDNARVTLGEVALGRGEYPQAATWLEAVRDSSPNHLDAQVKAGDAHWRQSQRLREAGKADEADAEAKLALERVGGALAARDQAATPLNDPARIVNANALAEIHRASGRPKEAVDLLEPIAKALEGSPPSAEIVPLYAASLSILLRAQLAAGQPERAIALMKVLETISPSKSALTQLYFELGRTLKSELETLERQNNTAAYKKTQSAYKDFLLALANSEAGQSYDSLQWAGESLLDLRMPGDAAAVFQRILDTVAKEPSFTQQPAASSRVLRTNLKLVAAYRGMGGQDNFKKARTLIQSLIEADARMLEPRMEKGMLLEAEARAASGADSAGLWRQSLEYWNDLAKRLRQSSKQRIESFEAFYHVALALEGLGKKADALSTLKGVMTITPSVGNPEMKARYEALVKRLSK